ncbi:hypothetical protein TNCV_4583381 [Trichonephila clavipes]|nr:hypothetical protein TNCV_4583381 [Trichonephila clavipes]
MRANGDGPRNLDQVTMTTPETATSLMNGKTFSSTDLMCILLFYMGDLQDSNPRHASPEFGTITTKLRRLLVSCRNDLGYQCDH